MSFPDSASVLHSVVYHQQSELMDVLSLLYAAEAMAAGLPELPDDAGEPTSPQSRLAGVLIMSREKLEGAVRALSPHV